MGDLLTHILVYDNRHENLLSFRETAFKTPDAFCGYFFQLWYIPPQPTNKIFIMGSAFWGEMGRLPLLCGGVRYPVPPSEAIHSHSIPAE